MRNIQKATITRFPNSLEEVPTSFGTLMFAFYILWLRSIKSKAEFGKCKSWFVWNKKKVVEL